MNPVVLAGAVPFVIGLVEVFKKTGLSSKFSPIVSLVVGVGMVILFSGGIINIPVILTGILTGLAASGTYAGTAAVKEGISNAINK